jgi:hypothetical protein
MTNEEFQRYRDGRYLEALNFYDNRAIWNKRFYYICSTYVLAVSGAICPVVLLSKGYGQTIAAILSPTVTVLAALAGLFRFHENWLSFRATWDLLKHEINWHDANLGLYAGQEDPHRTFVEHVEGLISREGAEWLRRHAPKDRGDSTGMLAGG